MADWATVPTDVLLLIAERLEFFEDFIAFGVVCKSWGTITSILGKNRTLPPRFPWVMLTDIAEKNYPKVTRDMDPIDMLIKEVEKNEYIEGMHKRRFFSFSTSKTYEFELPEATRKKCLGVGYGWLLTIGYDLQINLLHPFTRQQISMPPLLSFKDQYVYDDDYKPQEVINLFVRKAVMSSNPRNNSNEDCIILAIYGEFRVLAFARPGDEVWTNVKVPSRIYNDVLYYKGKFYAVDCRGDVLVCDLNDVNGPKATIIARCEYKFRAIDHKYLVESSGVLLLVIRLSRGEYFGDKEDIDRPFNHTTDFYVFNLEEWHDESGSYIYPYRITTQVDSLGDKSLFIGYNASISLPSSNCVKANCIYFSDDNVESYMMHSYGGGNDTGIFAMESHSITLHYASKFMSHLTPPIWFI
ncbi:hypothetical protein ACJIZ3_014401 [Penstemon smallii]|uniref:KIB1-4 beta-propeller domain-containing protein n=1 Tax=Penstemon smallii TaxID=265156 RepID=A0ABD3RJT9_9LAMI